MAPFKDVADHMNRIARGEVPFDVNYAEQLKTRIAALQRATNDGSARMALSTVRRVWMKRRSCLRHGSTPEISRSSWTVPPSPAALGQESIDAFNQARKLPASGSDGRKAPARLKPH